MTWRPQSLGEPGVAAEDLGSRVRVTQVDGSTMVLDEVTLRADSLAGWDAAAGTSVTVALSDVETLEAWKPDPGWLFLIPLVVALVVTNHLTRLRVPDAVTEDGS